MPPRLNLTGQTVGRLTILEDVGNDRFGRSLWKCLCSCGNETICAGFHLKAKRILSCGCSLTERLLETKTIHGHARPPTPTYRSWRAMIARCFYPNTPGYKNYGGRGIKVCDRWLVGEDGKHPFICFLEDLGERPKGTTQDRINPNGEYEPSNSRWASRREQRANQRPRS